MFSHTPAIGIVKIHVKFLTTYLFLQNSYMALMRIAHLCQNNYKMFARLEPYMQNQNIFTSLLLLLILSINIANVIFLSIERCQIFNILEKVPRNMVLKI